MDIAIPTAFERVRQRTRELWTPIAEELFDDDGLNTLFTHARNVLTGTVIVAAGIYAVHHIDAVPTRGMWTVHIAGYGVAAIGAILLLLNLVDGLRRLARRQHPLALRIAAILCYVAISARLAQVIVYFRSAP